jgi:hypothetical protein
MFLLPFVCNNVAGAERGAGTGAQVIPGFGLAFGFVEMRSAEASSLPCPGGSLFGSLRSGDGESASLSFIAPAPGHLLQRFEEVDKLPIRKRTEGPRVVGANKTPAIRDKAVHRLSDTRMKVSAGINAIVLGKTGNVLDLCGIWSHGVRGKIIHLIKVLSSQDVDLCGLPKDYTACPAHWFCSANRSEG